MRTHGMADQVNGKDSRERLDQQLHAVVAAALNSSYTADITERSAGALRAKNGGTTVRVESNSKDSVATRATKLGSR